MTQEEIIRMAREAGLEIGVEFIAGHKTNIERFAALVAAHEREACANLCSRMGVGSLTSGIDLGPWDCAEQIQARGER